jgi:hypothetical protein
MVNRHKYAAKMDQKKQNRLLAGVVQDRFPEVAGIVINMTYYQQGANPILMERTVNIFPSSDAYFKMDCMIKGCDGGGFDLTPVIAGMAKTRKHVKKGALVCNGNTDVASDHASVDYEIVIQYKKRLDKRSL